MWSVVCENDWQLVVDEKRREVEFTGGEQLLLNTRNIKSSVPPVNWTFSFGIKVGSVAYRLDLPPNLFDVECLLDYRWQHHCKAKKPKRKFLLRWDGYLPAVSPTLL